MKKQNKGITLVALVITIIVLIILAGVSINAVMNDGLITNAKDAKNTYQQEKENEEIAITDFEVETDFATKITQGADKLAKGEEVDNAENISKYTPYKFRNGFLTGVDISTSIDGGKAETVKEFRNKLPIGYNIYTVNGDSIADDSILVTTGMQIKKTIGEINKKVGSVIIYGDIDMNGIITSNDGLAIELHICERVDKRDDYQILGMDVNHDGTVDFLDSEQVVKQGLGAEDIKQDVYAEKTVDIPKSHKELEGEHISVVKEKGTAYTIEYDSENQMYILNGATNATTVSEIASALKITGYDIEVYETDGANLKEETDTVASDEWILVYYSNHAGRKCLIYTICIKI